MSRSVFFVSYLAVVMVLVMFAPDAAAFPKYSQDRDATNCRLCHGDFRADNYLSNSDRKDWGNLHNLHRNVILGESDPDVSRCDTCHFGIDPNTGRTPRFPVFMSQSNGGLGDGISCLGCHGRAEDAGNDGISGGLAAGLRQHHTNAGVNQCMVCHSDAVPANYTPVGENVQPPYYFTPDDVFLFKPTDACSSFGEENYAGIWAGLDNDGDGVYDVLDADCTAPFGKISVCHVPPDNPGNLKTITVNAASLVTHVGHGDEPGECEDPFDSADTVLGGRMYDKFWSEAGSEPVADHPLWATRPDLTSNPRTGPDTWRCKECHGWDYKGVNGAYASGSHRTGFPGIFGTALTFQEIVELLADPTGHDYRSQGLTYFDLWDLTKFVVVGQVDTATILAGDQFTGDAGVGQGWYEGGVGGEDQGCAVCHGADGMTPPLGHPEFDEFPQVLARGNPWEFQHKVRYGHPGTEMPGIAVSGGTSEQANDIGAYSQQDLP